MTFQTMLVVVGVGLLAGLVAGLVKNGGYGLTGDVMLGVGGGVAGISVPPPFALGPGADLVATIVISLAGAIIFIVVQRTFWQVRT
jgi:uncharacterized membrane protein YeaQ/YmgE (transglycosylase-associated protein family)